MAGEIVLKEFSSQKDDLDDYKVVKKGDIIESINRMGKPFHFIDLTYQKQGIFYHAWTGFRTTPQFKAVQDGHVFKTFQESKCKNAIVDSVRMSGSFNEANDWLANTFMPKMIANGLQNVAVILPENIFAKLSVNEWDKKIGGFSSRNFGSVKDALDWLRTA